MSEEIRDLGDGVKLKIESTREEESPRVLAIQLAEAYDRARKAQRDSDNFRHQSQNERKKAGDLTFAVRKVREARREDERRAKQGLEPVERKRMDPINTYDVDACQAERRECLDRANEFNAEADRYETIANAARAEIDDLQRKLLDMKQD